MKKVCILLAVLCMALTATACTSGSNQNYYESAQLYLGSGDFTTAADLFRQLGEYADSADYTLYCEALAAIDSEEWALARVNLEAVAPFKSSERYLAWLDAVEAEDAGDLEEALALYAGLGTFQNSHKKADELRQAIPEAAVKEGRALMAKGDYAAARDIFLSLDGYGVSQTLADNCTLALNRAAYNAADALHEEGDHLAAMNAFLALGSIQDAPARAEDCRKELEAALEQQYAQVELSTAAELAEAYAAIGNEKRVSALNARFGVNLAVLADAAAQPYVLLEDATLWQVQSAEGTVLTLRFVGITGAEATAAPTAEPADPTEAPAVTVEASVSIARSVPVKPTAAPSPTARPMTADLTPAGLLLKLDLTDYTFTGGAGTFEDPYK